MEVLVCKTCDEVIDYLDSDKAGTLYGCCQCDCEKKEK
ncbi:GapA-binding peptide SR1P [Marininema halotolerans]|uniref:SR1 protein n=1 Tax=Marininema halotolerans TaxID=1155944 RepID=A0A1I6RGN6_9BACL|nr:GapA-binding peptide SR1P [Marininema halotolerans]SFS63891.1 SR1 protein [Marininema halotolerans]